MDAHTSHARSAFHQRLQHPQGPQQLLRLFRHLGITVTMVQKATGAKSPEVVSNWRAGRSAPRDDQYQRLDALRVVVSYLLATNALDDDGLVIAQWLNSYPAQQPFEDERGRPMLTPLEAIRDGKLAEVVDAAQRWSEVTSEWREDGSGDTDGHRALERQ